MWFGPNHCNCCGDPPLPPCACTPNDCIPYGQPSSIKIEVEITDTWEWFYEQDLKFCSFNSCNETFWYQRGFQGISGLSQFNGTYECEYWADKEGGGLELADPKKRPCGVWVFPRTYRTVDVWHYIDVFGDVPSCGSPGRTTVYDESVEAQLYTHNASLEVFREQFGGGSVSAWPSFGLSPATLFGGALNHVNASITRSLRTFECDSSKTDIIDNYTWSVATGFCPVGVYYSSASMGIGPRNSGTLNGPGFTTQPVTDYPGAVKRYGTGTNPSCYVGYQQMEVDLPAYESEWNTTATNACTFDQRQNNFNRQMRGKAYWSAANYKITCIMEP